MSAAVNTVLPAGGVAFVTGGARGLGLAVALSFAREGCSGVTIIDVLSDEILAASKSEIEAAGAKVRCITHHTPCHSLTFRLHCVFLSAWHLSAMLRRKIRLSRPLPPLCSNSADLTMQRTSNERPPVVTELTQVDQQCGRYHWPG